jgi:hypothetical protein
MLWSVARQPRVRQPSGPRMPRRPISSSFKSGAAGPGSARGPRLSAQRAPNYGARHRRGRHSETRGTKQEGKAAVTLKLIWRDCGGRNWPESSSNTSNPRPRESPSHFPSRRLTRRGGQGSGGRERRPTREHAPVRMHLPGPGARPVAAAGRHRERARLPRSQPRGENLQKAALNPASAWILKRALARAGIRDLNRYGAHSLRAGFASTAFDNGVPEFKIRQQTGQKPRSRPLTLLRS